MALKSVDVACPNGTCEQNGTRRDVIARVNSLDDLRAGTKVGEICGACGFQLEVVLSAPTIGVGARNDHRDPSGAASAASAASASGEERTGRGHLLIGAHTGLPAIELRECGNHLDARPLPGLAAEVIAARAADLSGGRAD